MVRTGTRSPEDVEGAKEGPAAVAVAIAITVAETTWTQNMHLKEKLKDGPISKLMSTETGHRPTQYKNVIDTLPVLCANKNYQGLDDVIWNRINLVEAAFTLIYLHADLWSTTHHVEIGTANPANLAAADGSRPPTITMAQ